MRIDFYLQQSMSREKAPTWLAIILLFFSTQLSADVLPLPDNQQALTRISFGSCAFQSVPQPIFRAIADVKSDLYLSLGDAIYADYDLEKKIPYDVTEETLRREWQVLADSTDWQYLTSRVPVMATWDNHDYGHYQAGVEFPLKKESKIIFLDFFGEADDSLRRQRDGIYDAKVFGPTGKRTQIILLDTRSFKTLPKLAQRPEGSGGSLGKFAPNTDPGASLLGAAQWQWLEQQFQVPAELRLLVSSTQIVADQKGMDEWGSYPKERQRLIDLVEKADVNGLMLLSGNAHFTEISSMQSNHIDLIDFTSSGLTHSNKEYSNVTNSYRVAGPYSDKTFGMIEIDWDASPSPILKLAAMNEQGGQVFEYVVPLHEIGRR